jgi:hypothetical protein
MTATIVMRTVAVVLGLSIFLSGCAGYVAEKQARWRALYGAEMVDAWLSCDTEVRQYGLIPDFGMTQGIQFFKCMGKAGWVQRPRWNPRVQLGLVERKSKLKCSELRFRDEEHKVLSQEEYAIPNHTSARYYRQVDAGRVEAAAFRAARCRL